MKPQWIHHNWQRWIQKKNQALSNLESNEISTIEQQIETANEQIESLKSNISSVELQKKQTENSNNTDESDIKILTEKREMCPLKFLLMRIRSRSMRLI